MIPSSTSLRHERVRALLLDEISLFFLKEVKDPRISLVTLTRLKLAKDMRDGVVFYVVHEGPNDPRQREVEEALRDSGRFLYRHLRKVLDLKFIPRLNYRYDQEFENSQRVTQILHTLKSQNQS